LGFLAAASIAEWLADGVAPSAVGTLGALPLVLAFASGPGYLALRAAWRPVVGLAALAAMTAIAAGAGAAAAVSDDAQAGLALLWVPTVAIALALLLRVGRAVARPLELDLLQARLAALAIDATLLGVLLVAPVKALSDAGHEVTATVAGCAAGGAYLGVLVAWRGATLGHELLRLGVIDRRTGGRVPLARAVVRGVIVVVEVAAAVTIVLAPVAIADAVAVSSTSGHSLTDRLLGTSVVRR
jgi:hypothetical protein